MTEKSYFDYTEEENYALNINALAGIHDDAGIENYSMEGTKLLWEALEVFRSEFRARFPLEKPE